MAVVSRLSLLGMDMVNWVQILDGAVGFSHNANSLMKGIHPTILPPENEKDSWAD